jgi:hypothetical protein
MDRTPWNTWKLEDADGGCKAVAKRLQSGSKAVAKRLQSGCKAVAKAWLQTVDLAFRLFQF